MNPVEFLAIPEKRVAVAKNIVIQTISSIDTSNVFGIFGFGSFWSTLNGKPSNDIDMAVYTLNDRQFMDEDSNTLATPLTQAFKLPVEFHILTPYTPMVKNQLNQYKIILNNYVVLYGQTPGWL